jgi:Tat protein translocase TatC
LKKQKSKNPERNMSILEHLEEMRNRIIFSALFLVLGCLVAAALAKPAIGILFAPFSNVELRREEKNLDIQISEDGSLRVIGLAAGEDLTELSPHRLHFYASDTEYDPEHPEDTPPDLVFGNNLQKPVFFSPIDPIMLWLKTTIFLGLVISLPLIIFQIWLFVTPGLRPNEKKALVPILLFGTVLFPLGATFAYFAFNLILDFLLNFQILSMEPMLNAWEFLRVELKLMIGFGIAFELPIVIMFLTLMGFVDPPKLRRWRPYSILLIAVCSMMLTPPDPLSMLVMMGPLILLYEISIIASIPVARRRREEWKEENDEEDEEPDLGDLTPLDSPLESSSPATSEGTSAPVADWQAPEGATEVSEHSADTYNVDSGVEEYDTDVYGMPNYGMDQTSASAPYAKSAPDQAAVNKRRWKRKRLQRRRRGLGGPMS